MSGQPEFWLRGPIPEIPALLQPGAHALLQSLEEVKRYTKGFSEDLLWEKPGGCASVGFHIQHITGVLDRMLTYAKGESLSEVQFAFLRNEGNPKTEASIDFMVKEFEKKVEEALSYFKSVPVALLTETRTVGRKKLPSTRIGLLFHAAEHSQRHVGQLWVTINVLKA
ncbi:putative damage-inducible protein DinB [Saonia flava]|uniref:Putative damage-inducible protein DinB n=1 Tax=Saonia flava TaxID=523696 RepID=A0A846R2F3_9FLAO|nr:DinB family protein [Saonia flava]NJB72603.1 putative damage-inducible protein DinB [Saonia flava]